MFCVKYFPNFDIKLIIFFPILARGLFPKLLDKAQYNHLIYLFTAF